jgi:transcriptional regulator with XRE-family HTH domain
VTRETALLKIMGSRIRQRRGECSLTQEELADKAGLSTHYLSQIEAGTRNPTFRKLFSLSSVLQLRLAELVDDRSLPASD